jgi:cell division protein FtsX
MIFAASAVGLTVLLAVEPAPVFLLLTTVMTVVGVAAGTVASVLWFRRMLRRCSLRVRFGQA